MINFNMLTKKDIEPRSKAYVYFDLGMTYQNDVRFLNVGFGMDVPKGDSELLKLGLFCGDLWSYKGGFGLWVSFLCVNFSINYFPKTDDCLNGVYSA